MPKPHNVKVNTPLWVFVKTLETTLNPNVPDREGNLISLMLDMSL